MQTTSSAALDAGKHVICTKPFIDNLAQAADVLAAQARSRKQVMVGQSTRCFCAISAPAGALCRRRAG